MKLLTTILFLLIVLTSSAQKDTVPDRISIGFTFSPEYSNAFQQSGQMPKFAYSTGFNSQFSIPNSQFSIMLGLLLTDRGYKEHVYNTNLFRVFDTISHKYIYKKNANYPSSIKYSYNDHFIEIPVDIQYKISIPNSQFSIIMFGGVSLNYLIYSTTITDNYFDIGKIVHNRQKDTLSGTGFNNRFNLGGNLGIGLIYNFKNNSSIPNSHFSILIEPVYSLYIAPFSDFASTSKLNTIGIKFGLFYKLNSNFNPLPK